MTILLIIDGERSYLFVILRRLVVAWLDAQQDSIAASLRYDLVFMKNKLSKYGNLKCCADFVPSKALATPWLPSVLGCSVAHCRDGRFSGNAQAVRIFISVLVFRVNYRIWGLATTF